MHERRKTISWAPCSRVRFCNNREATAIARMAHNHPATTSRTYVGIDLGGGRGKTTAMCVLRAANARASVVTVLHRVAGGPLDDAALWSLLQGLTPEESTIAVAAPLTATACERCPRPTCPGQNACPEPAVQWLTRHSSRFFADDESHTRPLAYAHRATDLFQVYSTKHLTPASLSGPSPLVRGRALHLRRRLQGLGFALNQTLYEVSPRATVAALFGRDAAQGYKRDADPWLTRAKILAGLPIDFAPGSRFAREEVLQYDHRFDALLGAFTAWQRDCYGWTIPADFIDIANEDGWIWTP